MYLPYPLDEIFDFSNLVFDTIILDVPNCKATMVSEKVALVQFKVSMLPPKNKTLFEAKAFVYLPKIHSPMGAALYLQLKGRGIIKLDNEECLEILNKIKGLLE